MKYPSSLAPTRGNGTADPEGVKSFFQPLGAGAKTVRPAVDAFHVHPPGFWYFPAGEHGVPTTTGWWRKMEGHTGRFLGSILVWGWAWRGQAAAGVW